jgi:hypothetical protein
VEEDAAEEGRRQSGQGARPRVQVEEKGDDDDDDDEGGSPEAGGSSGRGGGRWASWGLQTSAHTSLRRSPNAVRCGAAPPRRSFSIGGAVARLAAARGSQRTAHGPTCPVLSCRM